MILATNFNAPLPIDNSNNLENSIEPPSPTVNYQEFDGLSFCTVWPVYVPLHSPKGRVYTP